MNPTRLLDPFRSSIPARAAAALLGLAAAVGGVLFLMRPLTMLAILFVLPEIIECVPYLAAVLFLIAALWRFSRVGREGRWPGRIRESAAGVAAALAAGLAWAWPDAALLVLTATCALALIAFGIVLILVAIVPVNKRDTSVSPSARAPRNWMRAVTAIGAVLVLTLMVAASLISVRLHTGLAQADSFYEWNESIPDEPGIVLREEPYAGEIPAGAAAKRILYSTSYSDGTPALASAVIAYPIVTASEPRQVLAWQHGTTGVTRSCAPSAGDEALTEYAIPGIGHAIGQGWAVVATDYPGQGTAGRYPYLVGEGEGRATLDGIRALQRVEQAQASNQAWIWGHSQGGHATLWAGQIAGDYAPEIEVRGVAALSSAWDPLALAERVTGAKSSALGAVITSLVLVPYVDEYADVTLRATVHPAGHGIVKTFASRCVAEPPTLVSVLVGTALGATADSLYRIDLTSGSTRDRLQQNIASGLVPAPLFLGQGVDDEVIPIAMQRRLAAQLCAASRSVETHEYPGRSHMGVIAADSPLISDLWAWAEQVQAGAAPENCNTRRSD